MTSNPLLPSHTLSDEKQVTSRLVAALQQEQDLLSGNGDADKIPDIINEKANIVASMATLADQRHKTLAALGFTAGENGMQSWIEQHGSAEDKQVWEELFALAQSARELNRLNGLLIGKQMAINQNAMNILQGKSNGSFYGPDGQSSLRSSGRPLGIG
ncbi:flagellar biosynthesis protein [Herbaspirillum hiltneri N3]|uniref:Flagellar biosynthesis protein n=1 Tax=Herbaspirillum hiltneri N3 TaxID=1262470 RepID=A0ABN4HVG3_9BURK|nr:flagellar protein FlgN [Herbaspirillum hiltneri]AKZ62993.1 flagellar biosynthesis protein [Herbaspirillum hiltneri N3]